MTFAALEKLSLESMLPTGKYGPNGKEGHTKVRVAIMQDARYMLWATDQKLFSLDDIAESLLLKQVEKQK